MGSGPWYGVKGVGACFDTRFALLSMTNNFGL